MAAQLSQWHRAQAASIAGVSTDQLPAATPVATVRAIGNHLSAQNDEPEPTSLPDPRHVPSDIDPRFSLADQRRFQAQERAMWGWW